FAGIFGRLRTVRAHRDRRPVPARAADQEPCRSERGGANARRGRDADPPAGRAQRRDRGRPRRLLDLGRRLRATARRRRAADRDRRAGGRARPAVQVRGARRVGDRGRAIARGCPRPRARADAARRRAGGTADLHRDARAARARLAPRLRAAVLGAGSVKIVVGHLFPDYLNIYADRANIAVLARRAAWRGHELEVRPLGAGSVVQPGEHDLFYVGGGQDREQELIAPALAALGPALEAAVAAGAAALAVCGGYQLFGRFYRDQSGDELPGVGLLPLHTVAGERRMIGDVLLECELETGVKRTLAGFENHAGRTYLDDGAQPLGRGLAGFGHDAESGYGGRRAGRAVGTDPRGPLLPRNPWLADWLLAQALAHRTVDSPPQLEPLPDDLEAEAHGVSAERARTRGGRY